MSNPVAIISDSGCIEQLDNGVEGSILTIVNDCPTWVDPADGGATLHNALTLCAGVNPALTLNEATQELCLDTTIAGSFDNTACGVAPDSIQGVLDLLACFQVVERVPDPVATGPEYEFDPSTWTLFVPGRIAARVRINPGAPQAIGANMYVNVMNWAAGNVYDTTGTIVTAPGTITIPRTGIYHVMGQASFTGPNQGDTTGVLLRTNGVPNQAYQFNNFPIAGIAGGGSFDVQYRLTAGDVLTLDVYSSVAATLISGSMAVVFVEDA